MDRKKSTHINNLNTQINLNPSLNFGKNNQKLTNQLRQKLLNRSLKSNHKKLKNNLNLIL